MVEQGDPIPAPSEDDRDTLIEIARLITAKGPQNGGAAEMRTETANATSPQPIDAASDAETLAAAGSVLARLLDVLPAGVALCREGALLRANINFALAFGYRSSDELRTQGGLAAILPDLAQALARPGCDARQQPQIASARTRSGRSFKVPVSVLQVAADPALSLLVLHPRTQGEAGVQEGSSERLFLVADALADGLILLDEQARVDALSAGAKTALGGADPLRPGAPFDAALAPADRPGFAAAIARLRDSHAQTHVERLTASLALAAAPSTKADLVVGRTRLNGERAFWIAIRRPQAGAAAAPIPESVKPLPAAQEAPPLSQPRTDFLAKVSHEVRTPLNSIIGFAELMKEERFGPLGSTKYREYVRDIYESGAYALSIINDLLDISKIEAGKLELNFTAVDTSEVVAEAVHLMQPQARSSRVVLRAALEESLPMVLADRRSLKQILLNLLSNAIKFTPAGGQAIVSSRLDPDGAVRLRVRDTGVGMTADEIAQAMEPFRQLDTAPRQQIGTGLGLPLTKSLVTANRARFEIESEARAGTRVDVVFPRDRVVG